MTVTLRSRWGNPIELRRAFPRPADDPLATVLIRPEVVTAIATAAAAAGADETGGPLLGTVQRSWDGAGFKLHASILGTVPPGPAVRGRPASVALGADGDGERAASALCWLRSVTGLELLHLGDWHKHPSGCVEPSRGDVTTARAMRAKAAVPLWLLGVVVSDGMVRDDVCEGHKVVGYAREASAWAELRLYEAAVAPFAPVLARPEAETIPQLPPLPWHITDRARFAAECRLLDAAGFRLAIEDPKPHRTVGLTLRLDRSGGSPLRAVTGPAYPRDAPVLVDDRGWRIRPRRWSPERFLVDVVAEVRS